MRIFQYRCPVYPDRGITSGHCRYEWKDGQNTNCLGCGKSFDETRTIWYCLKQWYWQAVPHHYRPKSLWYSFKCWGWKRYTTIKPRKLGHDWCDRDCLLIHVMFEVLCDFVEKEFVPQGYNDLEGDWAKELLSLYNWWINDYVDDFYELSPEQQAPWLEKETRSDPILRQFDACQAYEKFVRDQCKRLIDISPVMWT